MRIDIIVIFDDDPPMRYSGGKGKTYQHLINLMPPHDVYIETHLGGGAVLRHKKPALRNIGIELNKRVVEKWQSITGLEFELVQGRAENYLASYNFCGNELVYCDPPYLQSTRRQERVYACDYSYAEHESLLTLLLTIPSRVMISGYSSNLYDQRLRGWNKHSFVAMSQTGLREETVWFNFDFPDRLHDSRFRGESFRERQTTKRRMQRLQERVAAMDPVERHALIEWIDQMFPRSMENT